MSAEEEVSSSLKKKKEKKKKAYRNNIKFMYLDMSIWSSINVLNTNP